jgi:ubiquinone/menaquinone biosynthesis C-methylase UbiE
MAQEQQTSTDYEAVTSVMQQIWSKGDFAYVAPVVQFVADQLVESVDVLPGERVLDVACGSGNAAIAAARCFANVTGADFVPGLLEHGRKRAAADLLEVEFVEADAQNLPFADGSFDVVLSTFGAMFAPDQERTARELLRVTRSGGKIGMANWSPGGAIAELFQVTADHVPPPPGVVPPVAWGAEDRIRELFGDGISELRIQPRVSVQRFFSAEHYLTFFRTYFGPTIAAFERVGPDGEEALMADLEAWVGRHNRAGDRAAVLESEYVEVVAVRA